MGLDADGEAISSAVVDWLPASVLAGGSKPEPDPWEECPAGAGVTAPARTDGKFGGPRRRAADPAGRAGGAHDRPGGRASAVLQPYAGSGTPEQFSRALGYAEQKGLIGTGEVEGVHLPVA